MEPFKKCISDLTLTAVMAQKPVISKLLNKGVSPGVYAACSECGWTRNMGWMAKLKDFKNAQVDHDIGSMP